MRALVAAPILNRRLTLEEEVRTPDGAGGWVRAWTEVATLFCAVRAGAGREIGSDQARSRVSHRITVRAAAPGSPARPRADQRLRDGDRAFRIRAVAEADDRGRYLTVHADEEAVR